MPITRFEDSVRSNRVTPPGAWRSGLLLPSSRSGDAASANIGCGVCNDAKEAFGQFGDSEHDGTHFKNCKAILDRWESELTKDGLNCKLHKLFLGDIPDVAKDSLQQEQIRQMSEQFHTIIVGNRDLNKLCYAWDIPWIFIFGSPIENESRVKAVKMWLQRMPAHHCDCPPQKGKIAYEPFIHEIGNQFEKFALAAEVPPAKMACVKFAIILKSAALAKYRMGASKLIETFGIDTLFNYIGTESMMEEKDFRLTDPYNRGHQKDHQNREKLTEWMDKAFSAMKTKYAQEETELNGRLERAINVVGNFQVHMTSYIKKSSLVHADEIRDSQGQCVGVFLASHAGLRTRTQLNGEDNILFRVPHEHDPERDILSWKTMDEFQLNRWLNNQTPNANWRLCLVNWAKTLNGWYRKLLNVTLTNHYVEEPPDEHSELSRRMLLSLSGPGANGPPYLDGQDIKYQMRPSVHPSIDILHPSFVEQVKIQPGAGKEVAVALNLGHTPHCVYMATRDPSTNCISVRTDTQYRRPSYCASLTIAKDLFEKSAMKADVDNYNQKLRDIAEEQNAVPPRTPLNNNEHDKGLATLKEDLQVIIGTQKGVGFVGPRVQDPDGRDARIVVTSRVEESTFQYRVHFVKSEDLDGLIQSGLLTSKTELTGADPQKTTIYVEGMFVTLLQGDGNDYQKNGYVTGSCGKHQRKVERALQMEQFERFSKGTIDGGVTWYAARYYVDLGDDPYVGVRTPNY